jgi:hypothetical protein
MCNMKFFYKTLKLSHIVFIGIIFMICGCAATAAYTKFYEGPERPLSDIAILTEPNPYLRELIIAKIDDIGIPFAGLTELLPGRHKITATYHKFTKYYGSKVTTTGTASAEFHAHGGHVYEMYPVLHTHDNRWYIGIWDVTAELHRPEKQKLSQKIDEILRKNRTNSTFISVDKKIPGDAIGNLPGFGEKMKAQITGMKGKQIDVEYAFNRYTPYILVKGSDEREYHLKISQLNGSVENVLGTRITVGDFKAKYTAFQPINSDLAYVYSTQPREPELVYKEMPDGSYTLIK